MEKKCCICGNVFIDYGNNATPVKSGVCCNACNINFVKPGRLILGSAYGGVNFEIVKNKKQLDDLESRLCDKNFWKMESNKNMIIYQNPESEEKVVICRV